MGRLVSLTDEATAALSVAKNTAAAADVAARKALRAAAVQALQTVLTRPDRTVMTMAEAGLTEVHSDPSARLVVVSDGSLSLSVQQLADVWSVRLVEEDGGRWTVVSERLRSLADLGAALAGGR